MKKIIVSMILAFTLTALVTGCNSSKQDESKNKVLETDVQNQEAKQGKLEGHSLFIFCGAGMKDPFEEIATEFEKLTGCVVQVTYGNAAQIQTQIQTAKEGDFFIAGSAEEVRPVADFVDESKELVKHIPVIAVDLENSKHINSVKDLANEGVRLIVGDPEATPIGKIANKILADFSIKDKVEIISNTATAPAMMTALETKEADAAIIWKENVNEKKAKILDTDEMSVYIKTIPAAKLNTSEDKEAQEVFEEYLDSDSVKNIWTNFGYEMAE
ncbi:molybdate ABC transporter substrate-binding protein [Velocimicrobium porci]|uniref:Molybdate ABC transporter substrate-binding protein n=1 Tax=Velocimicrobium porci TaxID=2606634 RepID=A0A6L5XWA7_9FIRM|nr:molybdate ABC transporter substrate-binding protein [Velocimicrobium porci]MSS63116.1 molybdate ABC transporter substrate-binding protein [Velocimicrobium porci]